TPEEGFHFGLWPDARSARRANRRSVARPRLLASYFQTGAYATGRRAARPTPLAVGVRGPLTPRMSDQVNENVKSDTGVPGSKRFVRLNCSVNAWFKGRL